MERKASTVLRERDTPTSSLLRAEDSRLGGGGGGGGVQPDQQAEASAVRRLQCVCAFSHYT